MDASPDRRGAPPPPPTGATIAPHPAQISRFPIRFSLALDVVIAELDEPGLSRARRAALRLRKGALELFGGQPWAEVTL